MRFGMDFDSRRSAALGTQAAVATSTPAAAQTGYDILKRGGNAVDTAIAMAACLVITEPTSNGLGSDLFAIVWDGKKLHGLNASGRAPSRLTADMLRGKGLDAMPMGGWEPVTVPGMVDGWAQLSGKFGSLPLEEVLGGHSVLLAPTQFSATAPLKLLGRRFGFRAATMPGFTAAMIPALRLDYGEVRRRVAVMKGLLDRAVEARFLFEVDGRERHELLLDLRHRTAHASDGILDHVVGGRRGDDAVGAECLGIIDPDQHRQRDILADHPDRLEGDRGRFPPFAGGRIVDDFNAVDGFNLLGGDMADEPENEAGGQDHPGS